MSYEAELHGRRNKAAGQMFEKMIENASEEYKRRGIASIEKTPEPVKFLKRLENGRFVGCYEKKAQPDFKGVLMDGTCIVFDAKHTDNDRIQQDAVSEEQARFLDTYEKLNAHCYVIVGMDFQYFFRVPWSIWKNMKEKFGHKYMSRVELWPYRVTSRIFIAYLEGVEINDNSAEGTGTED